VVWKGLYLAAFSAGALLGSLVGILLAYRVMLSDLPPFEVEDAARVRLGLAPVTSCDPAAFPATGRDGRCVPEVGHEVPAGTVLGPDEVVYRIWPSDYLPNEVASEPLGREAVTRLRPHEPLRSERIR
jgi:hypothetical protein